MTTEKGSSSVIVKKFMQSVPDEVLNLILVFAVRGHKDMRMLALTCNRWRVFAEQDAAWKRLTVRGWGNRSDIIQIPIEKDSDMPWIAYYKDRILSHLPGLSYMKSQQHLTVSIRYTAVNTFLNSYFVSLILFSSQSDSY